MKTSEEIRWMILGLWALIPESGRDDLGEDNGAVKELLDSLIALELDGQAQRERNRAVVRTAKLSWDGLRAVHAREMGSMDRSVQIAVTSPLFALYTVQAYGSTGIVDDTSEVEAEVLELLGPGPATWLIDDWQGLPYKAYDFRIELLTRQDCPDAILRDVGMNSGEFLCLEAVMQNLSTPVDVLEHFAASDGINFTDDLEASALIVKMAKDRLEQI